MSSRTRMCAIGVAIAAAALGVAGAVSAQSGASASAPPVDPLLAEVRALRNELREAATASMRAQLLGMRLALQEQRINTTARQLSDVRGRLLGIARTKAPLAEQLKTIQEEIKRSGDPGLNHLVTSLQAQIAQVTSSEQQLIAEETQLGQALAEEQARWSQFNDRLWELEKGLEASPKVVR